LGGTVELARPWSDAQPHGRRLQEIGDARIELDETIADPTASSLYLAGAGVRPICSRFAHLDP